jgi:hypothetical protein
MKTTPKYCALILGIISYKSFTVSAEAAIIAENTTLNETLGGSGYWGQSFTVGSSNYGDVVFSWLGQDGVTELAAGNVFLLDQEYTGSPSGLSTATVGVVAESIGTNSGKYEFLATIILSSNTQYWAYMGDDSTLAGGGYNSTNNYSGGVYHQTQNFNDANSNYSDVGGGIDAGFRVSGTVVPEPSSSLFFGLAFLGVITRRSRTK